MSAAQSAPPAPRRKGLLSAIWVVGVLLLASLVGVGFLLVNPVSASASEIVLEGAAEVGANPFSADPFASAPPTSTPAETSAPDPVASPSAAPVAPAAVSGATPGLYGGTRDIGKCDVEQLITFLEGNPDKAAAWVAALNKDSQLRWPGGALAVADLRAYISSLTSVVLMADTRVTNHGFSGGVATPLQSVLQAGTAVLVDSFGVPRARCYCGNPLIPALPVPASTPITGTPWPGFDPNQVLTPTPTPSPIPELLLGDFGDPGAPFTLISMPAPGEPAPTSTPSASPSATPAPTASATPTAAPQTPIAPPSGLVCSPAYPGPGERITNTIINNTSRTLDIFSYVDCEPGYVFTVAPGETTELYNDWPGQYWVATSGSADPVSTHVLVPGGVWTVN